MTIEFDEILLVTPVWNDSSRLAGFGEDLAKVLAGSLLPIRWVIADDGSGVRERQLLNELCASFEKIFPRVELHLEKIHEGKGFVVRNSWGLSPDAAWYAFVDADGSVTPEEILRLIETAVVGGSTTLGIRKRTAETRVEVSLWRSLIHLGFLTAVQFLLSISCDDPQCGAKVLQGRGYRKVSGELCENGLAFDSELLFALKQSGENWIEVPLNWSEKKGGKVKPMRDAWGMLAALLRIRRKKYT